jgi:hypothetical protein
MVTYRAEGDTSRVWTELRRAGFELVRGKWVGTAHALVRFFRSAPEGSLPSQGLEFREIAHGKENE